MKNGEKYKTAQERAEAYKDWWQSEGVFHALLADCIKEAFAWLDLEAKEEEPLPCPFCGSETEANNCVGGWCVQCDCGYTSRQVNEGDDEEVLKAEAIAAHNRVAKASKESEAKK